jgi:phosphohistidine phosphatase
VELFDMQLLVVRHGIAVERDEWAKEHSDDRERPLTDEGKKKMKECAKGLRSLVPRLDVLATSPLTRALQTAAILAKVYEKNEPVIGDALSPGQHPPAFATWLRTQSTQKTVAIVGHEPGLGAIVSWFTAGSERSFLELGKGGAGLLEFGDHIEAGEAMLLWVLRPSHLRALS